MHYFGSDNTVPPHEENTREMTKNVEKDDYFPLSGSDVNYNEHSTAMPLC